MPVRLWGADMKKPPEKWDVVLRIEKVQMQIEKKRRLTPLDEETYEVLEDAQTELQTKYANVLTMFEVGELMDLRRRGKLPDTDLIIKKVRNHLEEVKRKGVIIGLVEKGLLEEILLLLKDYKVKCLTFKQALKAEMGYMEDKSGKLYPVLVQDQFACSFSRISDVVMREETYGIDYRLWTGKPTDEQRARIAWKSS